MFICLIIRSGPLSPNESAAPILCPPSPDTPTRAGPALSPIHCVPR
jgi:hypothetical protein